MTPVHRQKEEYLENLPPEYPARIINLILPIILLIGSTIFFFWWTGRDKADSFLGAIQSADFTVAMLTATLVALGITVIFLWAQRIHFGEINAHVLEGAQSVVPLLSILVLSWALSQIVKDLGLDQLVQQLLAGTVPRFSVPVVVFLTGGTLSYVMGSSWATWALLMPLASGLAATNNLDPAVVFGAVWAGGSVGDSTSPLSDIPVLVSTILDLPVAQYAGTALPFALGGILLAGMGYLAVGLL